MLDVAVTGVQLSYIDMHICTTDLSLAETSIKCACQLPTFIKYHTFLKRRIEANIKTNE